MRARDLIAEATTEYVKKLVDPALMTREEYYELINEDDKFHPSDAYQFSLSEWKGSSYLETLNDKSEFPKILKRMKINGINFEFRLKVEDRINGNYAKWNEEEEEYERNPDGSLIYYTKEELKRGDILGRRYDYTIGVFSEEDGWIGGSQDEWGCMLIRIADEYRGFGLGPILGKMARELEPDKTSGGMTRFGYGNFAKVHREFVREYVQSGMYSFLVKSGQITAERAKAIIASANLEQRNYNKINQNLGSNDPSDWLLYVGGYGDYVIYDKKLVDIINQGDKLDGWVERMVKGLIYVSIDSKYGRIKQFGGDNPKIKTFLMTLAAMDCKFEGVPMVVEPEDAPFLDKTKITVENDEPNNKPGYASHLVHYTGKAVDLHQLGEPERRFRKKFDRYDEFKTLVTELAYSKFRK